MSIEEAAHGYSGLPIGKIQRRLMPFLLLMYVLAFLDRTNVSFARDAFQRDTAIGDAAYAFGASIFFLGYALFEVPSNILLHRVGARLWMARIMVTWGLVTAAMMFIRSETLFYALRLLLGICEAGFFPGVIYYITRWYPAEARSRAIGLFYFGAPITFIFGGPMAGLLLDMDGVGGLHGWQWLFVATGLAAIVVGIAAYFFSTISPTMQAGFRMTRRLRWRMRSDPTRGWTRPQAYESLSRICSTCASCISG